MLPCSEVHWRILPAISRELAASLEKEKMARGKIAFALGTTPAAITQYLSGKRGGAKLDRKAVAACRRLARRIAGGNASRRLVHFEMAKIVAIAKKSKLGKNDPCIICMSRS